MSAPKRRLLTIIFLLFPFCIPTIVKAQQSEALEIVRAYPITEQGAVVGDIVSRKSPENRIVLSELLVYDDVIGVIVPRDETISYFEYQESDTPVASQGVYQVNVTDFAGPIKAGDFVSISSIKGKGQRAEESSDFIIGRAVEGFDGNSENTIEYNGNNLNVGIILVDVGNIPNPYDLGSLKALLELARKFGVNILSLFQTNEGQSYLFRYIIALVLMLSVIYFSFKHFGAAIVHGVEAIGRNPLARTNILTALTINAIMIVIVSLLIVVISVIIVRL